MVDQLSAFASEVTRVALEVGTQGILGGQAKVEGVQGTWADLTRNVNVGRFFFLFAFIGFLILQTENGVEFDGSSAFHLRGHQGRGTGRSAQTGGCGCAGRDVGSQGLESFLTIIRLFLFTDPMLFIDDRQLYGGAAEHSG